MTPKIIQMKLNEMLTSLSFSEKEKKIVWKIIRLGIYFGILILLVLGMWGMAQYYKIETFREYGPIENIQIIILFVCSFLFLYSAIKNTSFRPLLLFFSSLTTFCCFRELDSFFENIFPLISWKFAWVFPMLGMWYMFKKRKTLKKPLFAFLNSASFYGMFYAIVIFVPLAQCIGHRAFIEDANGFSDNLIQVRRMIEESMELMAYVLILLSSLEIHWELIRKK